jgi:small subunit ribosomal protein S14
VLIAYKADAGSGLLCAWKLEIFLNPIQKSLLIIALKKIIKDKQLPLSDRFAAQLKLSKLPRNSSKIRVVNRCEITGRPHGVYRKLKMSRIALREMASSGKIPGMTKSSW